jgi:pimeloyl-ACP methyl ester carboxylesterase
MTTDLAFQRIDGTRPRQAVAFLHGILGSGKNLRTIATRFIDARPDWSAWLVDLRGHGQSPKGSPGPSLEAVAEDVVALASRNSTSLAAVVGHSFGGKVALEVARLGRIESLRDVVTLDSTPSSREPITGGDSPLAILDIIESLPATFASVSDFVGSLQKANLSRELAQWLASSLQREGNGVRFGLNPAEIRAMLRDYFNRDLWPIVENPPANTRIHLVIADRSSSYSKTDRARAAQIAAANSNVTVDVLPAGHWVHRDDPDGLSRTLLRYME